MDYADVQATPAEVEYGMTGRTDFTTRVGDIGAGHTKRGLYLMSSLRKLSVDDHRRMVASNANCSTVRKYGATGMRWRWKGSSFALARPP